MVLDEEHDSSYKQDAPMPRYHARDLALDRIRAGGGRLVLGSATPSLDSWVQLHPDGPLHLGRLTQRISQQSLPPVHVVDMRHELAEGHRRLISRPLMDRLAELPEKGEQAVILVPRRGYSPFLGCRSCGEVVMCPNCDVALTVHRGSGGRRWLRCHWCDHRDAIATAAHCGSTAFKPFGAGTQKVKSCSIRTWMSCGCSGSTGLHRCRDGHRRCWIVLLRRGGCVDRTQMLARAWTFPR